MNATRERGFRHPSASRLARLRDTPLRDLLRGRLSARANYRRRISAADLAPSLSAAIDRSVRKLAWRRGRRLRLADQLIEAVRARLASGSDPDKLAAALEAACRLPQHRGIDPSLYLRDPLPAPLRRTIDETAKQVRGRRALRSATVEAVWKRFAAEHDAGILPEQIVDRFGDATVNAALITQLFSPEVVAAATLPDEILQLIRDVVQGTRLWPREKQEVAQELCEHFSDGLEAGQSSEQLRRQFGPTKLAARLVRRAKIRCRPLAWWAWCRIGQAVAASVVALSLVWLWLFVPFAMARPSINVDHLAEFDKRQQAIPRSERAWPRYRQGLEQLAPLELDWEAQSDLTANDSASQHWPTMLAYLDASGESIERFVEGSAAPKLGFVYRDPANGDWLRKVSDQSVAEFNPPGTMVIATALPHAQGMREVAQLLRMMAVRASSQQDGPSTMKYLQAALRASQHAGESSDFVVSKLLGSECYRQCTALVTRLLQDHPNLFRDEQLTHLAHVIASGFADQVNFGFKAEWLFIEDFLQHTYSNDGTGEGRFTSDGLRVLTQAGLIHQQDQHLFAPLPRIKADRDVSSLSINDRMRFNLVGPGVSAFFADRREMREKFREMYGLFLAELDRPLWYDRPSEFHRELRRLQEIRSLRRRFLPVVVVMSWFEAPMVVDNRKYHARVLMERDASLVAIASELYRRRNDAWPTSFDDLVPQILPQVPIDHWDGQPLRYRSRDDQPLLYSIGPDRRDDDGWPQSGDGDPFDTVGGDWVLLPVEVD